MDAPGINEVLAATGGRYDIEGIVGQGGMGVVYGARHRQLGSRHAIKVLPPEIGSSTMRMARFKREAALAANLSHPHIVPVFEFDVHEGLAFLVMPFVEGESLALILRRQTRLDYPTVRRLVHELGGALGFAHASGVVHRDVKPANILLEQATGRWMLTDFGIAHTTRADQTDITHTGAVVGTPAYMAPEQASGVSEVDGRADLYALAVVAYEALAGAPPDPLGGAKPNGQALRKARLDVPTRVANALALPLAVSRDERPATADRWLTQLQQSERRRTRVPIIVGASVALLASVVAGWLAWRPSTRAPPSLPSVAVLPFITDHRFGPGQAPLDSLLAQAFDWQLRYLPNHRVLGPNIRVHPVARAYRAGVQDLDTLLAISHALGATLAIEGRAVVRDSDQIFVEIRLHDVAGRRILEDADTSGALDHLNDLVSGLVVAAFAGPVARELTGWATSLPNGLVAFSSYWRGYDAFRRGAYQEAVRQFDEVIRLDSTFAPAHFNRMIAVILNARPTQATTRIRSALEAASRYRVGLDPISERLLAGYEVLVRDGHIAQAESLFADIVETYPDAVDAWFVLGYVQYFFRALLDAPLGEARFAFTRALDGDPEFAAALLQLAAIAALENDPVAGRNYVQRFLAVDSTSVRAELARMGDSLLYRGTGAAVSVLRSVNRRDPEVLELFSLVAGELRPPPGARPLAAAALGSLWRRAVTQRDQQVAFRMRLAHLLGTGRYASADSLVREAARLQLPAHEVDRWIVLSGFTTIPDLDDRAAQRAAVDRLRQEREDVEAQWLVVRWSLEHDRAGAPPGVRALSRAARDSLETTPLARSLLNDVEAVMALAAADTVGATRLWDEATRQYSVELVPFGLSASLWPLRVAQARLALAAGRHDRTLAITRTFDTMAGFIDQVVWPEILELRALARQATGERELARAAYTDILTLFDDANGAGTARRERARQALADMGT